MSDQNREAWQFYKRCKLTGDWPQDELVIEMGIALEEVYRLVERIQQMELVGKLLSGKSQSG